MRIPEPPLRWHPLYLTLKNNLQLLIVGFLIPYGLRISHVHFFLAEILISNTVAKLFDNTNAHCAIFPVCGQTKFGFTHSRNRFLIMKLKSNCHNRKTPLLLSDMESTIGACFGLQTRISRPSQGRIVTMGWKWEQQGAGLLYTVFHNCRRRAY